MDTWLLVLTGFALFCAGFASGYGAGRRSSIIRLEGVLRDLDAELRANVVADVERTRSGAMTAEDYARRAGL